MSWVTVATVSGRWQAFLARFGDVKTLADAALDDVLAAWSGLGYYRRARHLHAAARLLRDRQGGRLPRTHEDWRALPGVGEYAAGAIASIGLGVPVAAIDANVRRVLLRWHCASADAAARMTSDRLRTVAAAYVPPGRPGDWNQALMDLGAGPCRAGQADCARCPVARYCAAGLADASTRVPLRRPAPPVIPVVLGSLVLRHRNGLLLLPSERAVVAPARGLGRPVRKELAGLLSGLWSLPLTPWYADSGAPAGREETSSRWFPAAWRRWLRSLGWAQPRLVTAGIHRHAITSHRLRVQVVAAEWPADLPRPALAAARWLAPIDANLPLSSLARSSLAQTPADVPASSVRDGARRR